LESATDSARGIVALSIARLVSAGDRVFVHENEAIGKERLSSEMTRVAQAMTITWPPPPPETIGLLWHVITPGFDRSQGLLVMVQHLNVQPTSTAGSADELLLQEAFVNLRRMWDSRGGTG